MKKESRILSGAEIRENLEDPNYLPSRKEIITAFPGRNDLWEYCTKEEDQVFEFFNEEHLEALADYFIERIKECGKGEDDPLIILEMGAGNGKLSHFLQQKLEKKAPGQIKVVATDSGSWKIENVFPVEKLSCDEALETHKPDIVVFSWMPNGADYTEEMRECPTVKEYVLIGETGGGCCGNEWETWGCDYDYDEDKGIPPFEKDGFEIESLEDLHKLQICRTDYNLRDLSHSNTVSFKRKKSESAD
ncbi:MAG: hypothetical protein PHX30_04380 [Candidatus Pacebacteria bacterium]|nr:hypothetical protein [Candidatus Paceibacterota bacterium]